MPDNQASESSTLSNHIGILSASDATEPETAPRSDPSKPEAPLSQTGAGILKAVKPLSIKSFPNRPRSEKSPLPTTIANLHFMALRRFHTVDIRVAEAGAGTLA